MNHKGVLKLLATLFCFGIGFSVLSIFANVVVNPENYFILFFAVLVLVCIFFFKREDYLNSKNKKTGFLKVRDQEIIIGKESNFKKGKSLFLKVSIIAFLNK
ncbi:hypothetical protein SAMN04487977_11912 [Treponema bryantii]|uniref:Uncharacterized protein n=1 Tax=Treponema bryantii TaxID=163 RepID=A0A1H9JZI3_9SPIR|nr:hypothetical protein [Treponema bryantii]SEQ92188.1 hypothetical protein SAMN04487977_11912 [Treponema bryantii]